MSNPFDDGPFRDQDEGHPSLPRTAFTSDRSSPKKFYQIDLDDEEDEESNFMAFPQSTQQRPQQQRQQPKQSPNIFSRSSRAHGRNPSTHLLDSTPNLQFSPSITDTSDSTPRAQFTSRESPRRQKQTEMLMSDDLDDDSDFFSGSPRRSAYQGSVAGSRYGNNPGIFNTAADLNNSVFGSLYGGGARSIHSSSRSDRVLEPPQPIFSPRTYAEANPYDDDEPEDDDDATTALNDSREEKRVAIAKDDYDYDSYQKEFEAASTISGNTYARDSYADDDYVESIPGGTFSDRSSDIDRNMMDNIDNEYVPHRAKTVTKRKVRLVGGKTGNLVLENPIPDKLKQFLTKTESEHGEFTNMTYTACTCEPDEYIGEGFSLRAAKYGRETEIVVCVTMYNEDEFAFARTMHGVMKNVANLVKRPRSTAWGRDSWKKVQVIVVADGRNKVNESVLQLLTATGCYQENLARPYVNDQKVKAHLFEYTTQISIDENLKFKGSERSLCPVQVLFCLKESNQKKINSHRWLFNAFCPILDPNVVVLLDVGTKPDDNAIYNLWKAFDRDSNVAGAAGEIKAMKGKGWLNLTNPLVASQNFEYKMSNILDKPLESLFGYISVLPGALSAYRYIALKNHEDGTGPLASYFKGEDLLSAQKDNEKTNSKTNFFEANMYLAEDRILCWELVAKKNENWVLKFVKLATGETDVPESIAEFLSQRRRWINGAFFAALYSLRHGGRIWNTNHSFMRKFWLTVEFMYQFFTLVFSFFSLSNFYLTFYFLTGSLISTKHIGHNGGFWIFTIFNYICICCLTSLFIVSIGNRPQASRTIFKTLIILLTVCALYALIVGFFFVFNSIKSFGMGDSSTYVFVSIVVSLLSTYGLYTLMSILYLDPWHMLTCSVQYFLMIPSYTCTLQIFAFCNTHDVSWGTKGDNNPEDDKKDKYTIQKSDEGDYAVVVDVNVDEVYLETLYNIRTKRANRKVSEAVTPEPQMEGEDYAKDVRTRVVLIWLMSNLIFIMTMLQVYSAGETKKNLYLAFILWMVAVLALFRAIGSFGYLIMNYARFLVEYKHKFLHKKKGYASPTDNLLNEPQDKSV